MKAASLCALVVAIAAAGPLAQERVDTPQVGEPEAIRTGRSFYQAQCASCHGTAGEGKDSIAKMFKVEMKPLSSKEVQDKSDADLKKVILEGTGKMKAVKDLDAKNADDIVAYLRTLAKK